MSKHSTHGRMPIRTTDSITTAKGTTTRPSKESAGGGLSYIDPREERLFRALDDDNDEAVLARDFARMLAQIGLTEDDQRLSESMQALRASIEPDPQLEEALRAILPR